MTGDVRVTLDVKAQEAAGPVFGVVDANAGAAGESEGIGLLGGGDKEVVAEEVAAVLLSVDRHGAA